MTQTVTKLVVSTTREMKPLLLSVEHWKSLRGLSDHINIEIIAPADPIIATILKLLETLIKETRYESNEIDY